MLEPGGFFISLRMEPTQENILSIQNARNNEPVTNCDLKQRQRWREISSTRYLPYAFTENGVVMLSSVLLSEGANSVVKYSLTIA